MRLSLTDNNRRPVQRRSAVVRRRALLRFCYNLWGQIAPSTSPSHQLSFSAPCSVKFSVARIADEQRVYSEFVTVCAKVVNRNTASSPRTLAYPYKTQRKQRSTTTNLQAKAESFSRSTAGSLHKKTVLINLRRSLVYPFSVKLMAGRLVSMLPLREIRRLQYVEKVGVKEWCL